MINGNAGVIISIWSAFGLLIAIITFWTKFVTDRIGNAKSLAEKANGTADLALQEVAEAKNESRDLRDAFEEMYRNLHDEIVRSNRETGESNFALRQKLTEIELWSRDHYALKDDLVAAVIRIEAGQIRTDAKIEAGQTRADSKFDELRDLIRNGS